MRRTPLVLIAAVALIVVGLPVGATTPSGLPNASRTPGALNPAVSQATIHSTICVPGYTRIIRPPEKYTYALKVQQLHTGYAVNGDTATRDYEEDHLIALEIGGNPTSVKNLWPEPAPRTCLLGPVATKNRPGSDGDQLGSGLQEVRRPAGLILSVARLLVTFRLARRNVLVVRR